MFIDRNARIGDSEEWLAFCLNGLEKASGFKGGLGWGSEIVHGVTIEEIVGALVAAERDLKRSTNQDVEVEYEPVSIGDLRERYPGPYRHPLATDINADVIHDDGSCTIDRAREWLKSYGHELGEIYERFGNWCVTSDGIECLSCPYWIESDRIRDQHWIWHMGEKPWVNVAHFAMALEAAQRRFPVYKPPSPKRRPPGYRLSTEEKQVLKKHRARKQLKRARRLLSTQKQLTNLSLGLQNE